MNVLVLGGSTFMGRQLVAQLVARGPEAVARVFVLNRGRCYWGKPLESFVLEQCSAARVRDALFLLVVSDRKNVESVRAQMQVAQTHLNGAPWDLIVDFSGMCRRDVTTLFEVLAEMPQLTTPSTHYLYISTDSVYDVPGWASHGENEGHKGSEDSMSCSSDSATSSTSSDGDSYARNKLACDIYVRNACKYPYTILRLPDVIGPYDDTSRFWPLVLWAQYSSTHPLVMPRSEAGRDVSFVFTQDVIDVVHCIVTRKGVVPKANQVLDLCMPKVTLLAFIETVLRASSQDSNARVAVIDHETKSTCDYYPSVNFGALTCSEIAPLFGYHSTALPVAVEATVAFFNHFAAESISSRLRISDFRDSLRRLPSHVAASVCLGIAVSKKCEVVAENLSRFPNLSVGAVLTAVGGVRVCKAQEVVRILVRLHDTVTQDPNVDLSCEYRVDTAEGATTLITVRI